jgi:hypothetical protein
MPTTRSACGKDANSWSPWRECHRDRKVGYNRLYQDREFFAISTNRHRMQKLAAENVRQKR